MQSAIWQSAVARVHCHRVALRLMGTVGMAGMASVLCLFVGGCGLSGNAAVVERTVVVTVPVATATPVSCRPLPNAGAPSSTPAPGGETAIYLTGLLKGYTFGAQTAPDGLSDWFIDGFGVMTLCYPGGQSSGVFYVAVPPLSLDVGQRHSVNFNGYHSLHVEMRGATGKNCVHLGIKSANEPDDGKEATSPQCLGTAWHSITLPLTIFTSASVDAKHKLDLAHLYIPFEVVFDQPIAATVEFRNLWYSTSTGA